MNKSESLRADPPKEVLENLQRQLVRLRAKHKIGDTLPIYEVHEIVLELLGTVVMALATLESARRPDDVEGENEEKVVNISMPHPSSPTWQVVTDEISARIDGVEATAELLADLRTAAVLLRAADAPYAAGAVERAALLIRSLNEMESE